MLISSSFINILPCKNLLVVSKGLKSFENMLSEFEQFCRCHKSYIVNTQLIKHVKSDRGFLMVNNTYQISLSTDKSVEINRLINTVK